MISFNASGLVRFGSSSARTSWREASISRWDGSELRECIEPLFPFVPTKTTQDIERFVGVSMLQAVHG